MSFADNMASVLADLGEVVTITRVVEGSFDPTTGTSTPSTETTASAYGVAEPYNSSEIDGTNVLRTDAKITLSKISTRPEVGDTITMDGVTYRVMDVYPVRMSGSDIVYQVQGRV